MHRFVTIGFVGALAFTGLACGSSDGDDAQSPEGDDEPATLEDRDGEGPDHDPDRGVEGDETDAGAEPRAELCALLEDLERAADELGVPSDQDYEALLDASPAEIRAGLERFAAIIGGQGQGALPEVTPEDEAALDDLAAWDLEHCGPRE